MPITRASPNPQLLLVSGRIFAGRELYLEYWCCWNLSWVLLLSLAGCRGRSEEGARWEQVLWGGNEVFEGLSM